MGGGSWRRRGIISYWVWGIWNWFLRRGGEILKREGGGGAQGNGV